MRELSLSEVNRLGKNIHQYSNVDQQLLAPIQTTKSFKKFQWFEIVYDGQSGKVAWNHKDGHLYRIHNNQLVYINTYSKKQLMDYFSHLKYKGADVYKLERKIDPTNYIKQNNGK